MHMSVFACIHVFALEDQKRASDTLGLELQMLVSHHAHSRNQTQVLCNSNKCSC